MPFFYLNIVDDTKTVGLKPPASQVEFVHAGLQPNWYTKINTDYTLTLNRFQRKIQLVKGALDNEGSSQLTHFKTIQTEDLHVKVKVKEKETRDRDGPLWGRAYARSTDCPTKSDKHTLIVVGHCPTIKDNENKEDDFERFIQLKKQNPDIYKGCGGDKHCVYTACGHSLAFVDVASSAAYTIPDTPVEMLYLEHISDATATPGVADRYYNKMQRLVLDGRPTLAIAETPIIPKTFIEFQAPFQAGGSRFNRTRSKRNRRSKLSRRKR